MKHSGSLVSCALLLLAILAPVARPPAARAAAVAAPSIAPMAAQLFDLADVRLGPGPFRDAMERDRAYLLRLEPDRFLHTFRLNVGLPSTAEPYGGWEGPTVELRGHSLGHYLSACSLMVRSTGDAELKRRVDYIVAELARCQAASPQAGFHPGYLSAYPESFIDRVEARQEVWAPWYTLHKIMAGLLDAYQLAGNPQAREVLTRMADWIQFRVDHLTPAQMQASLQTEFGGMEEVLANLYAVTGNPVHLHLARAFDQATLFDPLAEGRDPLDGLHGNTQIPKVIGAAREYEVTGEARYRTIAENFWERVALHRSYAIGGHGDREFFFPVTDFARHLSPETAETCNTYNMLKLTRHLFAWHADARSIDFYERGLYNHILASQDPALGTCVYLMSLAPGHFKSYATPENSFWCCVGTGMENHAKYGDTIFARSAAQPSPSDSEGYGAANQPGALFVNLFIAAEVNWRERGVRLRQETDFPADDRTRLVFSCAAPVDLALRIRHPGWAQGALAVTVNGEAQSAASAPGSYLELRRTWRDGDRVEVRFPMALHTETLPGTPDLVAVLYGPLVLAGKLGTADMPEPYVANQLDQARFPDPPVPAFVSASPDWLGHVEVVSRSALLFRTRGLARPHDVLLAPFYTIQHERYTVYWHLLAPDAWDRSQAATAAVEKQWTAWQAAALDRVVVGDVASEGGHKFQGQKTDFGTAAGRGWRQAQNGGFFSYELQTGGQTAPLALVCAYSGGDKGRNFGVFVNDRQIATPKPDGSAPGDILIERYELPPDLTSGKSVVTVKFQAPEKWDAATANLFGCALVPASAAAAGQR